ncbi:MAG: pilus assembly protein [Pseudonocardiales bacterium]|nr:pilus assembly protein [Pseudonocardiales bacterium]
MLWRDERGQTTTELVIIMPVLLSMVLLIAQWALWAHATHIAQAAASEALSAARVHGGTVAAGQTHAQHVLDQLGRGPLSAPQVSVTRDARRATVTITGTATSVLPFLHLPVHAEAAGPLEVFHSGARP